jgi:hypothetical protein
MPGLQYDTFIDVLLTTLPEVEPRYVALRDELGGRTSPHMVVALVLEPFAKQALEVADGVLLKRVFTFFEEMACGESAEVRNLLFVGIFEAWVGERETLFHTWKYMGRCTKDMASDAAHRLNCGSNLPQSGRLP